VSYVRACISIIYISMRLIECCRGASATEVAEFLWSLLEIRRLTWLSINGTMAMTRL
jgi:hypothetical protein